MAALQLVASLAQRMHVALGHGVRIDRAQPVAELAQPIAESRSAIGELRRGALQPLGGVSGCGESGNQRVAALSGLVCCRSGRFSTLDEAVDTLTQRSQAAL